MLELNRVYLGDCLDIMRGIDDSSVDLIVTDPPYEFTDMVPYYEEMFRVLKDSGSIYVFGDKNMIANHWFSQFNLPYKDLLIWHYVNSPKPRGRWRLSYQSIIYGYKSKDSVFNQDDVREEYLEGTKKLNGRERPSLGRMKRSSKYDTSRGALPRDVLKEPALLGHLSKERTGHRDQKPLNLIKKLIKASSNEGMLVLDPFAGSGTTAIAASDLGRNFIAIELDAHHHQSIIERMGASVAALH